MLEIDQNILSKIKVSNIPDFKTTKKKRQGKHMLQWNDDLTPKQKWWPMRFHKKIIDGATLFSNFQTIISVLSLLTDLAYARDDFADTVDDNILHKTDLPFAD